MASWDLPDYLFAIITKAFQSHATQLFRRTRAKGLHQRVDLLFASRSLARMRALAFEEVAERRVKLVEAVEQRLFLPFQFGGQLHHVQSGDGRILVTAIRSGQVTERLLGPENERVGSAGIHRLGNVLKPDEQIVDDGHLVLPSDRAEERGRDQAWSRHSAPATGAAAAARLRRT